MHPNLEYSLARTIIQDRLADARLAESARDAEPTGAAPRATWLRWVAVASVALTIGGGAGATLASSGLEDRGRPTDPGAWPVGPIEFGDPTVVKGARGGKTSPVTFPYFGDPR